jgi:2-oxoglutarate dehydrogenase E1 component
MSTTSFYRHSWLRRCHFKLDADLVAAPAAAPSSPVAKPDVQRFIDAHRQQGYRCAALDPLGVTIPADASPLSPSRFGLAPADALTVDGSAVLGARDVHELDLRLKAVYCGPLALDCSAVRDEDRCAWLHGRMESTAMRWHRGGSDLLDRLIRVQAWEQHVVERFPDAKRFSLAGCETLIPLLDALIEEACAQGAAHVFMGMPHRGRVNVLVNVLGMPAEDVLDHFDPEAPHPERHRDLIYHLGGHCDVATRHGEISVTLAHNPSHLQSVYPVVTGMTRASQARRSGRPDVRKSIPVVLHGDAAFAGQGVVMETLMLTQAPGYAVGGVVHVIINNQMGFTQPNPMNAHAPRYCTDVTRMIDAPVLRANADAPDQVLRAAQIAVEYRMKFGTDVVIDLIGYRRLGHSEHDVPELTSPRLYAAVARHPSVVDLYATTLVRNGLASAADMASYVASGRSAALAAFARKTLRDRTSPRPAEAAPPSMAPMSATQMQAAVTAMTRLPQGFRAHSFIEALIGRWQVAANDREAKVDWCLAENLAYATTLAAGIDVRISGMDVCRGTFLHRHAVWHDQDAGAGPGAEFTPLQQLGADAGRFEVINSALSEEAVLGFEYGHSVQERRALTIWEAQFGDFVNGAQVFVDQYIAAGEEKWGYRSALALLLPHGHEGIGPEHSNAYLSRFLELCGGDNLRIACPSTAAQMFHLLRRQAFCDVRKPLVVMAPKTTLYKAAASHSPAWQLHEGEFQSVLEDVAAPVPSVVTRVVLCSGKLYYDLHQARLAGGKTDVALLRLEQFYPFPRATLATMLARYANLRTLVWAQEENKNQGAWAFLRDELAALCPPGAALEDVARPVTASGATSSLAVHQREQRELVARALGLEG